MTLLELTDVTAFYGPVQVLDGVSLTVPDEGAVGILGANGAGKTTTLRAISGTVRAGGKIVFDGKDIRGMRPDKVAALGIAHVPEGRGTLGGPHGPREPQRRRVPPQGPEGHRSRHRVLPRPVSEPEGAHQVPRLGAVGRRAADARRRPCRDGEAAPDALDEASLGLAPSTAKNVYQAIGRLRRESGIAMLVVEQNANLAFTLVDTATVLETGRNALTGTSAELKGMDEIRRAYLGG